MKKIEVVGVVGAGVMGIGLAQNLAQTGHRVILVDINQEILAKALLEIRKNVRFARLFKRGRASQSNLSPAEVVERIITTTDYTMLSEVDYVVENVTENWEIKREVFLKLDAICRPDVVFSVNTSCISITRVGALTQRADKVIGMHFMNPVPMKDTVEVIRGYHTSTATIARAKEFLAGMGKDGVVVNDSPGFVSNRVLMLTINEAAYLVFEGVSTPEDIDRIFVECFGHTMGPLATADLIGVDTILYSVEMLYEAYSDSKFRPCPLLKKMTDAGLHGRKTGEGFFSYKTSIESATSPAPTKMVTANGAANGKHYGKLPAA